MNVTLVIGLLALLAMAGEGVAIKTLSAGKAKAETELGAERQQNTQLVADLKTAGDSLTKALGDVEKWKTTCTKSSSELDKAKADVAAVAARLAAANTNLHNAEEKDRALPACQTLLNTDIAAACPDVARGLRNMPATGNGD